MSGEKQVGIVLVSHSGPVAEAVAELARGLAAGGATAPVAAAGGTQTGGLGTSAELIAEAARSVDGGVGIAVLVDLGSAVLTVKSMLAEGDELPDGARLVVSATGREVSTVGAGPVPAGSTEAGLPCIVPPT
ncbi:PTS sugar transporter subunit IIA domain-containing protein, partial [Streptomyces sp. NPDC005143]